MATQKKPDKEQRRARRDTRLTRKPMPDAVHYPTYCEMQLVGEGKEEHEVLWFQCEGGRWIGMALPPGKTFTTDGEFPDA